MGTILIPGGAAFRVWAPFASGVFAAGDFNQWSPTAHRFTREGNGCWYVEVPGAKIGDEYRFVIMHGAQPALWRKNPYASAVINSSGNAIIHDPVFDWSGDNFQMPPWNELVIYELHVGTFNDAPDPGPGTFEAILTKLSYLHDLGINAIEIMPVSEFSMDYSWGYNPAQPFSVESALGGPQGLYRLVKAAHVLGIAVILDVVYNHFGPGDLDLWRFDGWSDSDHDGGVYFYDNTRADTPWGNTRPDYGRGEVRRFIRDNALFWLNKYRLDGLRFDSIVNIRNRNGNNNDAAGDLPDGWNLLQWINNDIRASQPWKITIGEDLQNNEWITRDTGRGGAGFSSQWDAGFVHAIRRAVISANDADRDLPAVRDALYHRYNGDAVQRIIYTESHDEVAGGKKRVPEEIWAGHADSWFSRKRSCLGAAMVFTAPGIPMIFQGQEFLEDGSFQDTVPLDWARLQAFSGIHLLYRDLIRLRRNWSDRTRGLRGQHINVHHINLADNVLAFHRWENGGPGDDVVIVANFANRSYDSYALGMPRAGRWRVRFNSDWQGYSADFGSHLGYDTTTEDDPMDRMPVRANVGIGPYSVLILSQDHT
ncbi:MAG: alpha amylase C-terminal domain-containing protein [Deltaproteobacteria bacterium]|nr:alpha amylase C-terminal domain-containing protein [Deltaproteobacteria bacterium]